MNEKLSDDIIRQSAVEVEKQAQASLRRVLHTRREKRLCKGGVMLNAPRKRTDAEFMADFWSYVKKDPSTGCWLFNGGTVVTKHGYRSISCPDGKRRLVHRIAYESRVGPIPPKLDLCHSCDVTNCVNPSHLFPGTRKDNMQDSIKKGRMLARVLKAKSSKLNPFYVRRIRELRAVGWRINELAAELKVSKATIGNVLGGRCWRFVK